MLDEKKYVTILIVKIGIKASTKKYLNKTVLIEYVLIFLIKLCKILFILIHSSLFLMLIYFNDYCNYYITDIIVIDTVFHIVHNLVI